MADQELVPVPKFKLHDKVTVPFRDATSKETRRVVGTVTGLVDDKVWVHVPFGIVVLYDEKDVHG